MKLQPDTYTFHAAASNGGLVWRSRPAQPYLMFGHANLGEWWIDIQRMHRNAIAHFTRIVIEQVGRDDFEVVVGR